MLFCALLLSGCGGTGPTVDASLCPEPESDISSYLIGPGDTLQIVVWRNEELSSTVPVRPDGRISTPLIDDIVAAGRRPSQLAADMESVLSEYLRTPKVSVIVTQQGAANQVQVIGEVVSPQSVSFRENLRVLDAIVAVGGLTDFAAGNRANLVRQTPSGQYECRIRLKDLLSGDMTQNVRLFSGDVLVIPETRF